MESGHFASQDLEMQVCGICRRLPPPFERAVAFGSYDGALRDLLHAFKYQRIRSIDRVLGSLLAAAIEKQLGPELPVRLLVVPVPLHRSKRRQRGFNQAEAITRCALRVLTGRCAGTDFEYSPRLLVRGRPTVSQTGLTRPQRHDNLSGAFKVRRSDQVRDRELLIIDDVFTTGTTLSECARVLKRSGAGRVWVASVARVLKAAAKPPIVHPTKERRVPGVGLASAAGA